MAEKSAHQRKFSSSNNVINSCLNRPLNQREYSMKGQRQIITFWKVVDKMAIYIFLMILVLQTTVYGSSLQLGNHLNDELLVQFSARFESLEARDEVLKKELEELREEVKEEKRNSLALKTIIKELMHRLEKQEIEAGTLKDQQKNDTATATQTTGSSNRSQPETSSEEITSRASANVDANNGNNRSTRVAKAHIRGLANGLSPTPEDIGDVAFFANLGNHLEHMGTNQDIPFELVVTNRGKAYSPHTGAFTAPVPGTYAFATTLYVHGFNNTHYTLVRNGQAMSNIYVRGFDAPFSSSSVTAILELQQGDVVAVRNIDLNVNLNGNSHSSFAGFLLRIDYSGNTIVGKRNAL